MCEKPPYKVSETGWGEFTVNIKVTFVPEAAEKALSLQHPIKLHHWGEPVEAQPPVPAQDTPAETPDGELKAESQTPKPDDADGEVEPSLVPTETSVTEVATPADATTGAATPADNSTLMTPFVPTIASTYPVHAWQYDEMVFSDPPANFLAVLEQNPPTPLPSRQRRPRDQREEHEVRTGKKRARPSARPGQSRAGTEAPEGISTRAGTPASVATPTPGQPPVIGIAGELGSADVPLEFSADMEKGEHNRLTEVRIQIVREMDRWR